MFINIDNSHETHQHWDLFTLLHTSTVKYLFYSEIIYFTVECEGMLMILMKVTNINERTVWRYNNADWEKANNLFE